MSELINAGYKGFEALFERVSTIIEEARNQVLTSINLAEVYAKYQIRLYIVEKEQQSSERAKYGKQILQAISERLTEKFGSGWSYSYLRQMRQFYLCYSNLTTSGYQITTPQFSLSWSHGLLLMHVENPAASSFYVDLVFYSRLLQCYVLGDLKLGDLSHQDLGQMQMYVNNFDRYIKQDFEKPTVGILLCEYKSDALVELTLPKDANIYASAYNFTSQTKRCSKAKSKNG